MFDGVCWIAFVDCVGRRRHDGKRGETRSIGEEAVGG